MPWMNCRLESLEHNFSKSVWANLASPPGAEAWLPWVNNELWKNLSEERSTFEVFCHVLPIFTREPISVNKTNQNDNDSALSWACDLPLKSIKAYKLINWHCDFKSGYEWNPNQFYLDISLNQFAPGPDIKFPRELSRFQHFNPLVCGDLKLGGIEFLLQTLDWIHQNPTYLGVNWQCTMDVALRVINWIWGIRLIEPIAAQYPRALTAIIKSIYQHGHHIENNLEYSFENTGNHYLSNIAGLIYIGSAFPDFPESDRWLLFGLQELVSEMDREVYEDGYAHEASTNYHRLVAELFASCTSLAQRLPTERRVRLAKVNRHEHRVNPKLRNLKRNHLNLGQNGSILPEEFFFRLGRMAELLAILTKPNGIVPQFGDNDSGRVHKLVPRAKCEVRDHRHVIALIRELIGQKNANEFGPLDQLEAKLIAGDLNGLMYAIPTSYDLCGRFFVFQKAGIAVAKNAKAYLAVTCGPNGHGGRGGHGHNDKLSFELNIDGKDIFVDGGCPTYTSNPELRNLFRATASHNTIYVVDKEQDRWTEGLSGLFRLPEHSSPKLKLMPDRSIIGSHQGYDKSHIRRFVLSLNSLVIEDDFNSKSLHMINFNLDPEVIISVIEESDDVVYCKLIHSSGLWLSMELIGAHDAVISDGYFGIGYGEALPTKRIHATKSQKILKTIITWSQ